MKTMQPFPAYRLLQNMNPSDRNYHSALSYLPSLFLCTNYRHYNLSYWQISSLTVVEWKGFVDMSNINFWNGFTRFSMVLYPPDVRLHEFAMLQLFSFTVKLPELICQELHNVVLNPWLLVWYATHLCRLTRWLSTTKAIRGELQLEPMMVVFPISIQWQCK